jgi:hypothetical protein
MRFRSFLFVALLLLGASAAFAQDAPSVTWLGEDTFIPVHDQTAVDLWIYYQMHLVGGADPEGDANLTVTTCGPEGCFTRQERAYEGMNIVSFGMIGDFANEKGVRKYTMTLTLTDNGIVATDTLSVWFRLLPRTRR